MPTTQLRRFLKTLASVILFHQCATARAVVLQCPNMPSGNGDINANMKGKQGSSRYFTVSILPTVPILHILKQVRFIEHGLLSTSSKGSLYISAGCMCIYVHIHGNYDDCAKKRRCFTVGSTFVK